PPLFPNVGNLLSKRRPAPPSQFVRKLLHKWVTHPGSSSVRHHQEPARLCRSQEQSRDLTPALHRKSQLCDPRHFAVRQHLSPTPTHHPVSPLTATLMDPRKCCKQKTYGAAKPFRCNTYKKQGAGGVMVNQICKQDRRPDKSWKPKNLSQLPSTQSLDLSVAILLQRFFDRCRDDFADAFAQSRHILFSESLGLDGVVQKNRDFRRPEHPVARPVMLKGTNQTHGHDGNTELLRHAEAAVLELIHVPVARPLR